MGNYLKANFLNRICQGEINSDLISKNQAVNILGSMQGGYNVEILTKLLDNEELGHIACQELKNTLLIFDYYYWII